MGSSAVPTKRNPIKSERISSLSKLLRSQINTSFENIPLWHERDLSNSANERFTLPMTSILLDEMLETMITVIENLQVDTKRVQENLHITKGQIFAEFVLEALIKKAYHGSRHIEMCKELHLPHTRKESTLWMR